jgi:hypothetical protein
MLIFSYFHQFGQQELLEHHLGGLWVRSKQSLRDLSHESKRQLESLGILVVDGENFIEERKELFVVDEVVVNVVDDHIDLTCLLK